MKVYSILVTKSAEKSLSAIPQKDRNKIVEAIQGLASNPFPIGCKKLAGEEHAFRIRLGNYRIIYDVQGMKLIILVLKIGHRKDIYR